MVHIKDLEKEKIHDVVTSIKTDLLDLRKAYLIHKGFAPTKKGWIAWANSISGNTETNLQQALYLAYKTLSTRTTFKDVKYDFLINGGLV